MILLIYAVYIAAGTVAYVAFGMPIFDALNHAVAAVSTGGFSTRVESIGAFDSVAIEIVTIILMLLGNTNFFVHVHLFQRRFRLAFRHVELVFLAVVALFAVPALALAADGGMPFGQTVRVAVFQFVSAITTTGFQTIPAFVGMPSAFLWLLVVFMLVGAGIGSTGGGMKQLRVAIALKSLWWNLRDHLGHPRRIAPSTILRVGNREVVDARTQVDTFSFLMLYLLVFAVGSFVFMLDGHPVGMAMFEFASCLGTVGLSVGITGFAAPGFVLATGIAGMFLGRLEIVVVVYACSRAFGRKEGIVA